MEKKYCKHCRTLLTVESICDHCGRNEFQDIIIEVQKQSRRFNSENQL